jgi:hypothetical protein
MLLKRAAHAGKLSEQVAANLQLAYARNARRFRALRSGLHVPKVHSYQPGDYVFLVRTGGNVPGGALGLRAQPEVLKVIEVRPSGVLLLENQAGQQVVKHKELVAPCTLTNIDGTVHAGLQRPPANLACLGCRDPRQGNLMLLCDSCDAPWHTFCLDPPLTAVPEGDWLCPACIAAGMTFADVAQRRAELRTAEPSRPAQELPAPRRRRQAAALAASWHGALVRRAAASATEAMLGRVRYLGVDQPRWFSISWADGTTTTHGARVLPTLVRLAGPEPADLPAALAMPMVLGPAAQTDSAEVNWSIRSPEDILQRLQQLMPGSHRLQDAQAIHACIPRKPRVALQQQSDPALVRALLSELDFRGLRTVLDPWARDRAVTRAFAAAGIPLLGNDRCGAALLSHDPIEPWLYRLVASRVQLDAVVMVVPSLVADITLITALPHVRVVVCMCVPVSWVAQASAARLQYLWRYHAAGMLLLLTPACDPTRCWVCVFADARAVARMSLASGECSVLSLPVME